MLTMESRVGECLLAEKQGLCSESLSHARATASHDCILDTDDIRVFIERKEMSRGSRANCDWKDSQQVEDIIMPRYIERRRHLQWTACRLKGRNPSMKSVQMILLR